MRGRVPYGDATTATWHGNRFRTVSIWDCIGSTTIWRCALAPVLIGLTRMPWPSQRLSRAARTPAFELVILSLTRPLQRSV